MLESLRPSDVGTVVAMDAATSQAVLSELDALVTDVENDGISPVLACAPQVRPAVRRFVAPVIGRVPVVSYRELAGIGEVRSAGTVSAKSLAQAVGAGPGRQAR